MLMFDSLNRHMLAPYGCDWTHTPSFQRLANRAVTFERSYVCSMPCMPARRDLHTGRPGFLHRGWGPLEPFDRSVFDTLRDQQGVYSHLATDHYHYFEDGGANYHCRYDTWELFRGQEGDPWIGQVAEPEIPDNVNGKGRRQDWINRPYMQPDEKLSQSLTIDAGLTFIDRNAAEDNWLLQVECFDPHEPFFCDDQWLDVIGSPDFERPLYDWPDYGRVPDDPALIEQARRRYAALLAKCDDSLGKVLDAFDRHDMWKDTMLVVWTDHGILLGEHGWMMKNDPPMYEQISHTPLFIHDPRRPVGGERRRALVQPAIDLAPTLLGFFGAESDATLLGKDLGPVLADDTPVRDAAIFGYHGRGVNIVGDTHVYYRGGREDTPPASTYTMQLTAMNSRYELPRLLQVEPAGPFDHTHGVSVWRVPHKDFPGSNDTLLFDLSHDPDQASPVDDLEIERRMCSQMAALMREADAPPEQFIRLGVSP